MEKINILWINNIPSPYRVEFWNLLSEYCNLTVIYENAFDTNRDDSWKKERTVKYKEIYLNANIRIRGSDSFAPSIIKYLFLYKYDYVVIGSHGSPTQRLAIVFMRLIGKKFIFNLDGENFVRIKNDSWIKKLLKKHLIFRGAVAYLTTGDMSKKCLQSYGINENLIKIYPFSSIHNEDVVKNITEEEIRNIYKKRIGVNKKYLVLAVGSVVHNKGFDLLVKYQQFFTNDVCVCIVGGNINSECAKLLQEYDSKTEFKFIPFKTKDKLKEYFLAADVFTLPTRMDSWGLVINEACAYGLPIVTTNCCNAGLEMVKNDVNGYIVNINTPENIVKKINVILKDDRLNREMRKNSLLMAKKYTIETMTSVNADILEHI
mgnify:CR=1 FL=1